ncbi:thiol-disulfide oxidoreductase DCC family protein [uncultured Sphingorhabdus sp.]|uniref:thiol-disulfide oxidoreductase DCC family protein n=1 Tax=uncultured Sphingorhabdus sp. TaxID=1686106 RepID=UPI00263717ED|nr:DCC1-like thiol-disulfide oxidoreductase family protein [uncultured Sphingorhabdus sp.]HMS20970.1 DCC1-like thiol-disulfide oxidoreductase family protein [Sphingorhabdus sp.]
MAEPKTPYAYRDDPEIPAFDDNKALFVFDGVCVLCSTGATWLMRFDRKRHVNLTSAQGQLGQALYRHFGMELDESYLLIANGCAYTASTGYLKLCQILGGPWHLLRIAGLIPSSIRDWIYGHIAHNRYRLFGKTEFCALLNEEQRQRLI